jgi:phosphopantothenoylcysteine decarboxylase/phosphopantothenate--cysteine ligase
VAAARGAQVRLVAANVELPSPAGSELIRVGSAEELRGATHAAAKDADVVVMAAAVADFRPAAPAETKIKKTEAGAAPVELIGNPDVLAELVQARAAGRLTAPVIVGFAAETGDEHGDVLSHGRAKLARKGCDLLVVNAVSEGRVFGRPDTAAVILAASGTETDVPLGPKTVLSAVLCDAIASLLHSVPEVD